MWYHEWKDLAGEVLVYVKSKKYLLVTFSFNRDSFSSVYFKQGQIISIYKILDDRPIHVYIWMIINESNLHRVNLPTKSITPKVCAWIILLCISCLINPQAACPHNLQEERLMTSTLKLPPHWETLPFLLIYTLSSINCFMQSAKKRVIFLPATLLEWPN